MVWTHVWSWIWRLSIFWNNCKYLSRYRTYRNSQKIILYVDAYTFMWHFCHSLRHYSETSRLHFEFFEKLKNTKYDKNGKFFTCDMTFTLKLITLLNVIISNVIQKDFMGLGHLDYEQEIVVWGFLSYRLLVYLTYSTLLRLIYLMFRLP